MVEAHGIIEPFIQHFAWHVIAPDWVVPVVVQNDLVVPFRANRAAYEGQSRALSKQAHPDGVSNPARENVEDFTDLRDKHVNL